MARRAVTLFELLLVLALLVMVFGFAWPAIEGSFETSRLRAAADQIRAAFSETRIEAMRLGTPYLFRYDQNADRYSITRWDWNLSADADDAASNDSSLPAVEEAVEETEANHLPDGVVFYSGEVAVDQRAALTTAATAEDNDMTADQASPIIFYPDGTTSDAAVIMKSEQGLLIRVTLRGLTGISRVSEPMSVQELREEEQ